MLAPVLLVESIEAALSFYKDKLGFEELFSMPGPEGKLIHGHIKMGDANFMLGLAEKMPAEPGAGVGFYIDVGEADIDNLYKTVKGKGVTVVDEIQDQFWGDRTFSVTDLYGYRLTFSKHVRDVAPEEMMGAMQGQS